MPSFRRISHEADNYLIDDLLSGRAPGQFIEYTNRAERYDMGATP